MEMAFCSERGIPHSKFLKWSPEDRAKQHAYILEEATRCSSCGTQPWEWEENKRAYLAIQKFCLGCYTKSVVSSDSSLDGTTIELVPYSSDQVLMEQLRYEKAAKARQEVRDE